MEADDQQPRPSTETQRTLLAPSIAQSFTSDTATLTDSGYRGFASKEQYLLALQEWAESKRYIQPAETTLEGFYGTTTMETLASRPRHEFGISRRLKERKEKKEAKGGRSWTLGLKKAS